MTTLKGGSPVTRRPAVALAAALALTVVAAPSARAADPLKIAVFDFELVDGSAGGGVIPADATDAENLRLAAEEARRLLEESGRYRVVDAAGTADDVASAGGIAHCNGCEGALAKGLGAERSMAGIITRITRTEYTLQILVRDVESGQVLSNDFTGLRMGANYSWPRGVKWLMTNRVLAQ